MIEKPNPKAVKKPAAKKPQAKAIAKVPAKKDPAKKAPAKKPAAERAVVKKPAATKKAAANKKGVAEKSKRNLIPGGSHKARAKKLADADKNKGENGQGKSTEVQREDISEAFQALARRHQVFIEVYVSTLNATLAAIRAGYSNHGTTASTMGSRMLKDPRLAPVIDFMVADQLNEIRMSRERVLSEIEAMAKADQNDIVELRRVCCRYCHSEGHVYMETPAEGRERAQRHEGVPAGDKAPAWDDTIVLGFNGTLEPHPDCPECWGEGEERLFFKDTRHLPDGARALYAGANWGKDGLRVNTYSKEVALERLAKHHKLYEDKTDVNIVFSTDELEDKYASRMKAAHEKAAQVREERGLPDVK